MSKETYLIKKKVSIVFSNLIIHSENE